MPALLLLNAYLAFYLCCRSVYARLWDLQTVSISNSLRTDIDRSANFLILTNNCEHFLSPPSLILNSFEKCTFNTKELNFYELCCLFAFPWGNSEGITALVLLGLYSEVDPLHLLRAHAMGYFVFNIFNLCFTGDWFIFLLSKSKNSLYLRLLPHFTFYSLV